MQINTATSSGFNPAPSTSSGFNQSAVSQPSQNQYLGNSVLGGVDDINKDKFGFIEDELSLHDAFTLRPIKLKIPENVYQQVVMQNSKLWIFTQRSNMLVKTEVDAAG